MAEQNTPRFHVLIPAAGSGSRMGMDTPKQYLPLLGKPVIRHTLTVFSECARISAIHVILSPDDQVFDQSTAPASGRKIHTHYCGGESRAATVFNGLVAIGDMAAADDWVLVHDAARPCLSKALLDTLLGELENDEIGGLLAIPLADTLKRGDSRQRVAKTELRDGLWQAQTPQMFRFDLLKRALRAANGAPTDESQAVEALGFNPKLVQGELRNLKITYPQDLLLAEAILSMDLKQRA